MPRPFPRLLRHCGALASAVSVLLLAGAPPAAAAGTGLLGGIGQGRSAMETVAMASFAVVAVLLGVALLVHARELRRRAARAERRSASYRRSAPRARRSASRANRPPRRKPGRDPRLSD